MNYLIILLLLFFLILRIPIAFSLSATSLVYLLVNNPNLLLVMPQRIIPALDSFALLAIPLYILAGLLIVEAGLGAKMVDAINLVVGRFRGGLAHVNILTSLLFGGISSSSVADTAALGSILIPTMEKNRYPRAFATVVTVTSSPLSAIIPPSTLMIIYSSLTDVSIAAMFAGGIAPGVLLAAGLMVVAYYYSRKNDYGVVGAKPDLRTVARAFVDVLPALFMPVIIIGGIFSGIFTATEAGAVAVIYGLLIAAFWYRNLTLTNLTKTLRDSVRLSASVGFIVAAASLFGWVMTIEHIPSQIATALLGISEHPIFFLLIVNVLFLFLGMFLNAATEIVILVPIFLPTALAYGIDPIHFGLMVVVNMGVGAVTPPVGICLLAGTRVGNIPLRQLLRPLVPFLGVMLVVLLLVMYVPAISLYLPNVLLSR